MRLRMPTPRHSIRRALLARMMGPLLLIMLLGGASAYALAQHFSQTVLDDWLYDSAISLANLVKWENGRATVDLPEGAREILEWDVVDRIYYEVISERGERLIGNATLPPPPDAPQVSKRPVYYDSYVADAHVRVLAIAIPVPHANPVIVKVAETRLKRNALASQVLWISVALSLLLAAVSGAVIWYAIGSGMASMERAVRDVRSMHAAAPLSPIAGEMSLPQEVLPLVHEINDLIENLSAAHRLNQRFIADAAHQLRTPLATLRVQLELAVREKDPSRHLKAIDVAVEVLTRMARTLHQLLTLAKADEGDKDAMQPGFINLDLIAREEVERRLDDALGAGIDLGYSGAGEPVLVRGTDELLREAVANLLDNALRYGGTGARVTVGLAANPPAVYVEDNGPGIPIDQRSKVAERFYRMPGTTADGCGLGLAIVTEIVKRHGGTLVLESACGATGLRARLVFAEEGIRRAEEAEHIAVKQ
jgi:two-component system sensor histidine kinase TctE